MSTRYCPQCSTLLTPLTTPTAPSTHHPLTGESVAHCVARFRRIAAGSGDVIVDALRVAARLAVTEISHERRQFYAAVADSLRSDP